MAAEEKRRPGRPRKRPRRGTAGGRSVLERYGVAHYQAMSARGNAAKAVIARARPAELRLVDANLTLTRGLLERATAAARELGVTRSGLIRLAIEDYLAACDRVLSRKNPAP